MIRHIVCSRVSSAVGGIPSSKVRSSPLCWVYSWVAVGSVVLGLACSRQPAPDSSSEGAVFIRGVALSTGMHSLTRRLALKQPGTLCGSNLLALVSPHHLCCFRRLSLGV